MRPENFTLNCKRVIGLITGFQDTNNGFFSYCLFFSQKKTETVLKTDFEKYKPKAAE